MNHSFGADETVDQQIQQQIEKLYNAVLAFRTFVDALPPRHRQVLASELPWSEEGMEIWIDFEAWVQASQPTSKVPRSSAG